jgi:hypothetical protein
VGTALRVPASLGFFEHRVHSPLRVHDLASGPLTTQDGLAGRLRSICQTTKLPSDRTPSTLPVIWHFRQLDESNHTQMTARAKLNEGGYTPQAIGTEGA